MIDKLSDATDLIAAKVEAAYREGYDAMRHQYHLANDVDAAWEASASKLGLDQPMKVAMQGWPDAMARLITLLNAKGLDT